METEMLERDVVLQPTLANKEHFRAEHVLSTMVAALAAAISIIGLRFPAIYGSNWGNGTSLGNDLVTLVVAVPVLVLSMIYAARGSARAHLLWLGSLYYMVYNYAFYVFGIPVTPLFVPIVAAFALSGVAVVLTMFRLDAEAIGRRFTRRTPARPVAVYLFYVAVMISFLWISQWVKFVMTGHLPEVNGSAEAYHVIAAVDLTFLVGMFFPAACLLWKRNVWGYLLGVAGLVQGAIYLAVMATVCVFGWKLNPGSQLFSGWFINCIVGCTVSLLCLAALLGNLKAE